MPVASADTLPNGLTVTCSPDSDIHATCIIGGCPRVNGDYVVDALHVMTQAGGQREFDFKCINGQTHRHGFDVYGPTTFGVQACRKKDFEGDWCTPYADYTYTPPVKAAPPPPPPVVVPPPPPPPPVVVPDPPKVAPTNAVTMNISVSIGSASVDIASSADIPGSCTYNATAPLLPSVNKKFDLAPNGSTSFTTLSPPLLATYHVVLSCKGQFDGKTVEFGHVEQDVTAAG
ncbi:MULTISPECIES: hypothetical protein [unclassified Mycobacterium]|uniref:hypothetical protein n=1 Tax=unclassified Mycobacterium TaxID=2642494 RepID=UPI0029C7FE23|nr:MULTISPECIES: hypothetical protein [unclassified Mycobacterium]